MKHGRKSSSAALYIFVDIMTESLPEGLGAR